MKFSRIAAILMFAVTLTGTVPAQAGVFEFLAGLFVEDKPQASPSQPAQSRDNSSRRKNGKKNKNGRIRKNPVRQVADEQPARNPRAQSAIKVAKIKQALARNAGLIAVGLVVSAVTGLLLNPETRAKITEVLNFAKAGVDNINIFKDAKKTAQEIRDGLNGLVDEVV